MNKMRKTRLPIFLGVMAALVVLFAYSRLVTSQQSVPQAYLAAAPTGNQVSGAYLKASPARQLAFPEDHGSHPDYQTEWWYYTGNLKSEGERRYGYQLTFFRRAITPPDERVARESRWATDQVYMAHFALSDIEGSNFHAFERFSRGSAGLAGAQASPYQVWLNNWQVREIEPGVYQLRARQDDLAIELTLTDQKGPVLHGEDGYSQKGPDPGDASHYYSLSRLLSEGEVKIGEKRYPVSGTSWMDHEFSTSALSGDQIGWDWFSLQLDDRSELMVFQIRREDGSVDPFSSGTLIAADGSTRHLSQKDFTLQAYDTWSSSRTGAQYPARWSLNVPSAGIELEIAPYMADQELDLSYAYWEGAVNARGIAGGRVVGGDGYVEMTGYAGSMAGEF